MSAVGLDQPFPSDWGEDRREALTSIVREALGSSAIDIRSARRLAGGAINEHWCLELAGGHVRRLVLRKAGATIVPETRPRAWEYAVQMAAYEAGVLAPQPIFFYEDSELLGRNFFLVEHVPGTARPRDIVAGNKGSQLAARLARELAIIHRVGIPQGRSQPKHPALDAIDRYRRFLDGHAQAHPVLEWGLHWLELNAPAVETVLSHGDFRTGNYMVKDGQLTAVLDWEFADWGDPHADLAWFCAKCWRVGMYDHEAGGLAPRSVFCQEYEAESGRRVDPDAMAYWEVMAHVRWGIIALQQVDRFLTGVDPRLEHALLGRRLAELEFEILRMTGVNAQ